MGIIRLSFRNKRGVVDTEAIWPAGAQSRGEIAAFFAAPAESLKVHVDIDRGPWPHRDAPLRRFTDVAWMGTNRRYPGEYRFTKLAAIAMVEATREPETADDQPAPLDPARLAQALRAHWRIDICQPW